MMNNISICWIDFTVGKKGNSYLFEVISKKFESYCLTNEASLSRIANIKPTVLVFMYNSITSNGLFLLEKTRRKFPLIPILMVTQNHSEALAIWALRARVWDYFVQPVSITDFTDVLMSLPVLKQKKPGNKKQKVSRLKAYPSFKQKSTRKELISRAISYIKKNYQEDLTASSVAEYAGMSTSHFSRQFYKETGQHFNQYLWLIRVDIAKRILIDPNVSITSVCFDVGGNDPSYFTRKFRELESMTPSEYQTMISATAQPLLHLVPSQQR